MCFHFSDNIIQSKHIYALIDSAKTGQKPKCSPVSTAASLLPIDLHLRRFVLRTFQLRTFGGPRNRPRACTHVSGCGTLMGAAALRNVSCQLRMTITTFHCLHEPLHAASDRPRRYHRVITFPLPVRFRHARDCFVMNLSVSTTTRIRVIVAEILR